MDDWHEIGPHRYRCEPGGILFLRVIGDLEGEQMRSLIEPWSRFCDSRGQEGVYWLVDLTRMGSFTAGARKVVATTPLRPEDKGTVIFGATFQATIIISLINKAARLLQGPHVSSMVCRASEAEGRAWIEERRRSLRHAP